MPSSSARKPKQPRNDDVHHDYDHTQPEPPDDTIPYMESLLAKETNPLHISIVNTCNNSFLPSGMGARFPACREVSVYEGVTGRLEFSVCFLGLGEIFPGFSVEGEREVLCHE